MLETRTSVLGKRENLPRELGPYGREVKAGRSALGGDRLTEKKRQNRMRHRISGHVPTWIRLRLPDAPKV
ncbi:hypothetical protein LCGC14_2541520 [marine sediment metagenome]|uniref:Uncharacterized protein n=1 Tax=marine sediment metagenome TaxID=412755 RepID=A0A0F9DIN6_9ZZZZ